MPRLLRHQKELREQALEEGVIDTLMPPSIAIQVRKGTPMPIDMGVLRWRRWRKAQKKALACKERKRLRLEAKSKPKFEPDYRRSMTNIFAGAEKPLKRK